MIGLTGGIASGKSTVSKRLRELGAFVLDADEVSREVVSSPAVLERLREEFGEGVFLEDGALDRAALAAAAFATEAGTKRLNAITHPAILDALLSRAFEAERHAPLVFADVPLLIESGFYRHCDSVWLVTADIETRLKRIFERDGLPRELALDRMARQLSDEEKLLYADVVINNNGELEELLERVDREYFRALENVRHNSLTGEYAE